MEKELINFRIEVAKFLSSCIIMKFFDNMKRKIYIIHQFTYEFDL